MSAATGLRAAGHGGGQRLHALHPGIAVGEHRIAEPERVQGSRQIRHRLVGDRAHEGLHEGAIEREVQFRQPGHGGEGAVILGAVAPERADVVERAGLEAGNPVAGDETGRGHVRRPRRNDHFVETGRQAVDDVHQLHELLVLLRAHLGRTRRWRDARSPGSRNRRSFGRWRGCLRRPDTDRGSSQASAAAD